ncbi:hypothetical protein T4A_11674 [Trichinella pseudospiralis]|uniref:Uncharacterized protein n=1 Tax=Trichinella pseudospiralis TaxID=6337 RepID=A0A0V1CSF6_TRIPS|nr:hypothetical protein T4A_11674 [Trichinella pseudospiralis]
MAFYNGLSEKIKFMGMISKINKKTFLFLNIQWLIKASEARSMAFYRCLREKGKVHGDDFKNR